MRPLAHALQSEVQLISTLSEDDPLLHHQLDEVPMDVGDRSHQLAELGRVHRLHEVWINALAREHERQDDTN